MQPEIAWQLSHSPSVLVNFLRAVGSFGKNRSHPPPVLEATLPDVKPDTERYAAFLSICGSKPRETLHMLYPFALCYPLAMRVLASRAMPFSMARVLNSRNLIDQTREISLDETLSLSCRSTPWRRARIGREVDLLLDASIGEVSVWHCTATYLIRGANGAGSDSSGRPERLAALENAESLGTWRLESRDRIRFAEVSGDVNGLHFWPWYARRLGFSRDFAQPLRVVTRCLDLLPSTAVEGWPRRLEFRLKGPAYYGKTLTLSGAPVRNQYRFDLHLEGEPRPCIVGQMDRAIRAPVTSSKRDGGTCSWELETSV